MDDDPLVAWSLATFHTALLVALLVTGLYLVGPLGDLLSGLDTVVGLALYGCLWASTWWTTRRWLAEIGENADLPDTVGNGGKWGGVDGVLFFWTIFAIAIVPTLGFRVGAIPFFLLALAVGSVLALGIGGFVGSIFAVLDVAVFWVASRVTGRVGGRPTSDPTE